MTNATAIVHAAPATGARFIQFTAEIEADGTMAATKLQRFCYVIEGSIEIENRLLRGGGYAYLPPGSQHQVSAIAASRIVVIEKELLGDLAPPEFFTAHESDRAAQPLMGDVSLQVNALIPDRPEFDFAVNTMTFDPGASLSMVEMHVMEHGLLMLEGGGIYRLGNCWYPVTRGDFIYMAPFCPQWFGALGKSPSKYLIYKDWNRHPAA